MNQNYKPIIMMSLTIAILVFLGLIALVKLFELKITFLSVSILVVFSILLGLLGAIDIYKE